MAGALFRQLFDAESCTYTYLVADLEARVAALVDPVRERVDRDLKLVEELELTLAYVLDTHVHADHVTGAGEIRRRTGARTMIALADGPPCADQGLVDGDVVRVGSVTLRALATPGHTVACLSYVVETHEAREDREDQEREPAPRRVLTGDALLVRGCGRTDFQGGDAGTLWDSVTRKLFPLGDDVVVCPAHDYNGMTASSIGEERRWNPRLGGAMTRERFIALMAELHLPPPKKISEAVPANRACGDPGRRE